MEVALAPLVEAARHAAASAYAPYSRFRVGSAVLTADGRTVVGCNVENASYGLTICAERVAVFRAVSEGATKILAAAVVCVDADPAAPLSHRMPCGACRQVFAEFMTPDSPIEIVGAGVFALRELLPNAFILPRPLGG
jgi:cytidine deaminase